MAVVMVVIVTYFSKNNLTPSKPMRFLRAAFRDLAMFLFSLPYTSWWAASKVLCAVCSSRCNGSNTWFWWLLSPSLSQPEPLLTSWQPLPPRNLGIFVSQGRRREAQWQGGTFKVGRQGESLNENTRIYLSCLHYQPLIPSLGIQEPPLASLGRVTFVVISSHST